MGINGSFANRRAYTAGWPVGAETGKSGKESGDGSMRFCGHFKRTKSIQPARNLPWEAFLSACDAKKGKVT